MPEPICATNDETYFSYHLPILAPTKTSSQKLLLFISRHKIPFNLGKCFEFEKKVLKNIFGLISCLH